MPWNMAIRRSSRSTFWFPCCETIVWICIIFNAYMLTIFVILYIRSVIAYFLTTRIYLSLILSDVLFSLLLTLTDSFINSRVMFHSSIV